MLVRLDPDYSKGETADRSAPVNLQKKFNSGLNLAIVGGGPVCYSFLKIITAFDTKGLNISILGLADSDLESPGVALARQNDILVVSDYHQLYHLEGLNTIVDFTGQQEVQADILSTKPRNCSLFDHRAANLIIELLQTKMKKVEVEREREE